MRMEEINMNSNDRSARSKRTRGITAAAITAASLAIGGGSAVAAEVSAPGADAPVFMRESRVGAVKQLDEARQRYDRLYEQAKKLDVEPKRNTADEIQRDWVLRSKIDSLEKDVRQETEPEFGTPESVGISQSTLDSIAACESGGDPTAVDASGTYRGKYQFDLGTWASVGGSGDPAAAPEAEQDYRAAVLLSQAGSSPWPVCG
jgi:hypothetical protein